MARTCDHLATKHRALSWRDPARGRQYAPWGFECLFCGAVVKTVKD